MTNYLLSIDPGLSTGVSLISYEEGEAPKLETGGQFGGGAEGIRDWISGVQAVPYAGVHLPGGIWVEQEDIICEAFTARSTQGFSYKTDSLEALVGIGVLIDRGLVDRTDKSRYRSPALQYLVGGATLADKRKRQHKFLKDSGFYRTGKDFGTPDADDFRSATAHGLNYLARELKHKPTFDMISDWVEEHT